MIQVGIVGLGRSGWGLHAASLRKNRGYRIAAVCDVRADRLAQAADELGCAPYRDFADFLAHTGLELVVVASRTSDHAWMARAALEKGCHVVVEKPLAVTLAEAERVGALARKRSLVLSAYYNYRFSRDFVAVKDILRKGWIGRPYLIRRHVGYFNRRDDWQSRLDQAGGILNAATIHFVDQITQLAGAPPERIDADVRRLVAKGDAPDHSKVILRFPGGLMGDVEVSWAVALPDHDWSIYGTRGAIRIDGPSGQVRWFDKDGVKAGPPLERSYCSGERIRWKERRFHVRDGFTPEYYDRLADAIRKGAEPPVSWDSALETYRLMQRCAASAR